MLSLSQRFVKVFRPSPFFHFFLKSIISNDQESVTALRMLESKMRGRAKKSTNLTELGNQKVSEAAGHYSFASYQVKESIVVDVVFFIEVHYVQGIECWHIDVGCKMKLKTVSLACCYLKNWKLLR